MLLFLKMIARVKLSTLSASQELMCHHYGEACMWTAAGALVKHHSVKSYETLTQGEGGGVTEVISLSESFRALKR